MKKVTTTTQIREPKRSVVATKKPAKPVEMPPQRVIRDPAFAKRLETAIQAHPHAPEKHYGLLRWLGEQMAKAGDEVSPETCRKWVAGEARPRPGKMEKLAQVLEVDPAWLSMGIDPVLQPHERKVRNAMADGAVNLVAGFIQMDGGYPAFPEENDRRAQSDNIDLYAIIRGANYSLHVALGERTDDRKVHFIAPTVYENVVVLGVVRDSAFRFQVFEVPVDVIKRGHRRGGSIDVFADITDLRKIENFRERL